MRLPLLLVLSLATATTAASAQTTWQGLHFGESRDDVHTQLTAQNLPVGTSQDGSLQSNTDYELPLPGLRHTFPMLVNFHFDDNATLADITLSLDLSGMRRYWAAVGSDEALSSFAAEHLTTALSGRYGAPLYRSTTCDAEPKQGSSCVVSWHGTDQTVELEHLSTPNGPRLLIHYQPLATAL